MNDHHATKIIRKLDTMESDKRCFKRLSKLAFITPFKASECFSFHYFFLREFISS